MLRAPESSVLAALGIILLLLAFSPARETFYSAGNQENLSRQIALLAVFAIGEAIVIITAGIDLSLGSLIAFCGMLLGVVMTRTAVGEWQAAPAILTAILLVALAGLLIGCIHALFIQRLGLPPFVVTLASLSILKSAALLMNQQLPIPLTDFPILLDLGRGKIPIPGTEIGIPIPVVFCLAVVVLADLLLRLTTVGRHVYAVGSNEEASRLTGVQILKVKIFAYGSSATLGGVAGVLYAAYGTQGDPSVGAGYELNAVAAAVIGGCSLAGGRGSVIGTLLGACLLNVILSAINLTIERPSLWEGLVVGGVLLVAMFFNVVRTRLLER